MGPPQAAPWLGESAYMPPNTSRLDNSALRAQAAASMDAEVARAPMVIPPSWVASAPDAPRARTEIAATPSSSPQPVMSSGGPGHTTDGGAHAARIAPSLQTKKVHQDSQMAAAFGLASLASQAAQDVSSTRTALAQTDIALQANGQARAQLPAALENAVHGQKQGARPNPQGIAQLDCVIDINSQRQPEFRQQLQQVSQLASSSFQPVDVAWLDGGRVRCPAFSCGKPLKPASLIHHLESRACGSIVDGVDYRGKGPETLGPLAFEYLKGLHRQARAELSRICKLRKSDEMKGKEAQFATEQAQAMWEQMELAPLVRNPMEGTGKGRTEREEKAQSISIPTHLPGIRSAGSESSFASQQPSRAHEQPGNSGYITGDDVRVDEGVTSASVQHPQPHSQVLPGGKGTCPVSYGLPQRTGKLALHWTQNEGRAPPPPKETLIRETMSKISGSAAAGQNNLPTANTLEDPGALEKEKFDGTNAQRELTHAATRASAFGSAPPMSGSVCTKRKTNHRKFLSDQCDSMNKHESTNVQVEDRETQRVPFKKRRGNFSRADGPDAEG
jgi:hypothetical protein